MSKIIFKFAEAPMQLPSLENVNINSLNFPVIGFYKQNDAVEVVLRNGVLFLVDGTKVTNIDFKGMMRKTIERSSIMGATLHMLVTNTKLNKDDMSIILTRTYDSFPGETKIKLFDFVFEKTPNIPYQVRLSALLNLFKKELVQHNQLKGEFPSMVETVLPIRIASQMEMVDALSVAKRSNCNAIVILSGNSNYQFGSVKSDNNMPGGYFPVTGEFNGRIEKIEPKVTREGFIASYIVTTFDNGKKLTIPIKNEATAAEIWKVNKQLIGKRVYYKGNYVPYTDSVPGNLEFVCIKNY